MAEALMQMYETMTATAQKELYDFALFLVSRNEENAPVVPRSTRFGALRNKISYIAPDFDAPLDDFAEYM